MTQTHVIEVLKLRCKSDDKVSQLIISRLSEETHFHNTNNEFLTMICWNSNVKTWHMSNRVFILIHDVRLLINEVNYESQEQ